MKSKLVKIVFLCIIINCQWGKCDSDFETDRAKRTVGVFFKSLVNAFQTQRQPAPNVVSFKPSRQQNPQSIKTDILSSSKALFLQKQNLFKPSTTTLAPLTKVISTSPPITSPDQFAAEPILQDLTNQPEAHLPKSPISTSFDSFTNPIPPDKQHPLFPLKAQVLILPFQEHQDSKSHFAGFGLQPDVPNGASPFNYQAQIYFQPPVGVNPSAGYPGRYSIDNGWHDGDDILSKGVQAPSIKDDKSKTEIDEYTTLKNIDLNKYEAEKSETVSAKYIENPKFTEQLPYNNEGYHDSNIEDSKKDGHFQNYYSEDFQYLPPDPLSFPHSVYSDFNANYFSNNHKEVESRSNREDKGNQVVDESCRTLAPEVLKNLKENIQPVTASQNNQDRPRVSDAGVLQNRNWTENTVLDFTPQRGISGKLKEKSHKGKYNDQPNYNPQHDRNHFHYPEQDYIYHPELNDHFSDPGFIYLPEHEHVHHSEPSNIHLQEQIHQNVHAPKQDYYYNYESGHFQGDQYHTKIGKLPNGNPGYGNQFLHSPANHHQPQQTLLPYGPTDPTEITDSLPNGYFHFKRSYLAKRQS